MDVKTMMFIFAFLIGIVILCGWLMKRESNAEIYRILELHNKAQELWKMKECMLIDRIMSVDYVQYKAMNKVSGEKKSEAKPKPPDLV